MMLNKIGLGLPRDSKGREADASRSAEDWDTWKNEMKEKHPIKYFLNQEFEALFVWPITMPILRAVSWVRYRTIRRYHIVSTGMKPGYSDMTERMLHVNFNMLKDFVEIEKAHMFNVFGANDVYKHNDKNAGIAHLLWEMSLDDGSKKQAENAREIYDLYNWWIDERPLRVDSFETPEHNAYWKLRTEIYGVKFTCSGDKENPELKKLQTKAYNLAEKLQKSYSKEDEKNLIRLMKIREALWT
jgi:hypothetical protein